MRKTITFKFENQSVAISGNEIIIPRIGEKICISNLFNSNDERKEYNKNKNKNSLYVVDIFHDISIDEQNIDVTLSTVLDDKSDFYNSICNCAY